uniref:Uncharacterized protein n=1 Tax=Arundo donax TaxID=35708 RepID=A0A0A9HEP9_ARUDO
MMTTKQCKISTRTYK